MRLQGELLPTHEDLLFMRAVELGCQPLLVYAGIAGRGQRWICPCSGHIHAEDRNASFFITPGGLRRAQENR